MESIHIISTVTEPVEIVQEAQLVCHNDPFNPNDTTILIVPTGALCSEVLKDFSYDSEFYDLIISKNQEILDVDFIIEEHDIINFITIPKGGGGGKQIMMIVAIVALAVLAGPAAGALVGAMSTGGMAMSAAGLMMTSVIQVGITMVGMMLISSLFKPNTPSQPSLQSFEQSSTYGWNTSGNAIAQGNCIPILYGTMRITPQYIGKYLDTINDSQYLRALLALCEGPIDNLWGVEINDTDIGLFRDVQYDARWGNNDQSTLAYFNDTWIDQNVGKKLIDTNTWVYSQTQGDAVNSITIGLVCPNGIYYANDTGGMDEYTVKIDMEYRKVGTSTWSNIPLGDIAKNVILYYVDHNPTIETRYTQWGYAYQVEVANTTGPYDVYQGPISYKVDGVTVSSDLQFIGTVNTLPTNITGMAAYPPTSTYGSTTNYVMFGELPTKYAWTSLSSIYGLNYYVIKGNKPSAIRKTYKLVGLDPAAYEIRVRYYENPSISSRHGSTVYFEYLQEAISDDFTYPNTALLALNILATNQISGGLPKITCVASRTTGTYGRLDNPAWACLDLLMNTRYGAGIPLSRIDLQSFQTWANYCTTENFTVNLYLDQNLTLMQSLQLIGQLGRGNVLQYGSIFSALVDKPDISSVQGFLFSMGNIIENSFSETFLPLKDRANIVEVTYYDYSNNYDKTVIEVSQGNYDLTHNVNKTSINLLGCTSKLQALRQAKYHLNQNRYLTITASWEASIDAIACKIGDIVNVAHDVPQWGYSGRIISSTTNTITIDREDLQLVIGKTYYIQVSDSNTDEQVYKRVVSIIGSVLTLGSSIGVIGEYSVYAFGEVERHAKKMRVLSISTAGDLKRKITAIEYNPNVYNDIVSVPTPILIQDLSTKDLIVSEYMQVNISGNIENIIQLVWKGAALSYTVLYKRAYDSTYTTAGVARANTFEISGLVEGITYDFLVDGAYAQYTLLGQTTPPPEITLLIGSEQSNTFILSWTYQYKPVDFDRFNVYADSVLLGSTINNNYSTYIPSMKAINFSVVVVDRAGNTSLPVSIVIQAQQLAVITGLKTYYINEYTKITWDRLLDSRSPVDYEVRMGEIWESGSLLGITNIPEYTVSSNGTYMVKAHYQYPDGSELYSSTEAQITISGAVLPKNIIASYDEKATGWLGTKTNLYVNADGNLELMSENIDIIPIIDNELIFDFAGGIKPSGIYEVPVEHIVDIGVPQVCRIWVDYAVEGRIVTERVDSIFDFNSWISVDGRSSDYILRPQIAVAQADGIFGVWQDFVVGEYIGRKFKFRGVFYSLSPDTTCILSKAIFFIDMPDKIQSATGVTIPNTGSSIIYPIPFQVTPNLQITITGAQDGDDVIVSNETALGFDITINNAGLPVQRKINWLAKGY